MTDIQDLSRFLVAAADAKDAKPIWIVRQGAEKEGLAGLPPSGRAWLEATGWKAGAGKTAVVPAADGGVAGVVLGLGETSEHVRNAMAPGALPSAVPKGTYRFAGQPEQPTRAAAAWLLGCYQFRRYKKGDGAERPSLVLPEGADRDEALRIAEGMWLGRDLINTPASDLGPSDLAAAARKVADRHGASCDITAGDDLIAANFPMIHAVGRASTRPPCLVDIKWSRKGGRPDAPRVTLVGKGICFDTGGLDIKPASAMLLMKKDMGGAATALAAAHMIMAAGLDVRLRVLISAAENSISGNAFRPGDILDSRAGLKVEIGNTDAEGRLVLGDALTLADDEKPDLMMSFATLTGAARVALGPELPAMFSTDDAVAQQLIEAGLAIGDPCWRMPFWSNYDSMLLSDIADVNHVSDGPFAGAVTAALFLKRFVKQAKRYVHVDMFGWVPSARSGQPKGGEAQMARATFEVVRKHIAATS